MDVLPGHEPHTIFAVTIREWNYATYPLACPVCGQRELSPRVQNPPSTVGEIAWAVCADGHEFRHPLIYPEFVRTLIQNAAQPLDLVERAVAALGWLPHHRFWPRGDSEADERILPSDAWAEVAHQPWTTDDFERERHAWPELVATLEQRVAMGTGPAA